MIRSVNRDLRALIQAIPDLLKPIRDLLFFCNFYKVGHFYCEVEFQLRAEIVGGLPVIRKQEEVGIFGSDGDSVLITVCIT